MSLFIGIGPVVVVIVVVAVAVDSSLTRRVGIGDFPAELPSLKGRDCVLVGAAPLRTGNAAVIGRLFVVFFVASGHTADQLTPYDLLLRGIWLLL